MIKSDCSEDAFDDSGKTIASAGHLVFKLKEYKGNKTLDIRKYFYKKGSKEFLPTTKGLSVTRDTYKTMQNILNQHEKEIANWFDEDGIAEAIESKNNSRANARVSPNNHSRRTESWKSPDFFAVESKGGEDTAIYNESHSLNVFIKKMMEDLDDVPNEKREKILQLLDMLIISFHRSRTLFDNSPVISPDSLFETLLYNWGVIFQNYLDSRMEKE